MPSATPAAEARERPAALVTGAGSGLGRACVAKLRHRGHAVAALDLDPGDVEADFVAECDVADAASTADAVGRAVAALGGLGAAAHCAGAFQAEAVPTHALDPSTWERTVAVNLTGSFAVARAVLPALAAGGGALVLVASAAASQPQPGAAAYAASKGGVAALARALALEYAHVDVRVNSISPGWIDTGMASPVLGRADLRARVEAAVPVRRVAQPEEVAASVAWLLSPDASYVTGHDLAADGGLGVAAYVEPGGAEAVWRRAPAGG